MHSDSRIVLAAAGGSVHRDGLLGTQARRVTRRHVAKLKVRTITRSTESSHLNRSSLALHFLLALSEWERWPGEHVGSWAEDGHSTEGSEAGDLLRARIFTRRRVPAAPLHVLA